MAALSCHGNEACLARPMGRSKTPCVVRPVERYVMLTSRIHWHAGMARLARAVVECAGVGVRTSDFAQHRFNKLRRPIYPLDPMTKPSTGRGAGCLARGGSLLRSKCAFSVWISGNRRMAFAFDGKDAMLVDYQDCH